MLNKYAENNARGFIHAKETVLPDDYPVNYGYAYVAVFDDGEVRVISSDIKGTVVNLKQDLAKRFKDKVIAEIRRCDMGSRNLFGERP